MFMKDLSRRAIHGGSESLLPASPAKHAAYYSCMCACMLSCFSPVQLFEIPWTIACQAPLSMGFFRWEYWSGFPCPPPGDLSGPEIKSMALRSPALAGRFFTTSTTWKAHSWHTVFNWICIIQFTDYKLVNKDHILLMYIVFLLKFLEHVCHEIKCMLALQLDRYF